MSFKKRYLDTVARARTRARRLSLGKRRLIAAAIIFVLLVVIMSFIISPFGFLLEQGKASPRAVMTPRTVQYIDNAKTKEERAAAAAAVQDVYVVDAQATSQATAQIQNLFNAVADAAAAPLTPQQRLAQIQARVSDVRLKAAAEALLGLSSEQLLATRDATLEAVSETMAKGVSSDSLEKAREQAASAAAAAARSGAAAQARQVASAAVTANLVLDTRETARRKKAASDSIKSVITTKLAGETIINKGEVVTADEVELLKSLGFHASSFTPLNVLVTALLVLLIIAAMGMYLARFRRSQYDSPGLLLLLGSTVVVYAVAAKLLTVASSSWAPFWGFLMPTAAVATIVAVLFDPGTALVVTGVCAVLTGVITGGNFSLVTLSFLGGFFPSLYAARTSTRHQLRRIGLYTAFWVAAVAFVATAIAPTRQGMLLNTGIGFLNGAFCAVVAMGCLPFLETTFRVTTHNWLLELASPEQELLKELSLKAPGTYSHSMMVANLSEAAAREIGSDPLLARVAAYYHDVGKLKRPQFFVENQTPDSNPHDGLSPNLSTLIIVAHVKDGVEMLQVEHFPPDLVDIIKEHHGTSLVRYFYESALEVEDGPVDESRFRYHFPKPHRRTSGVLMLADSLEAAARSLRQPSAATIEQTVERIVQGKLDDGQLDECDLTFDEINRVKQVFDKILLGTHHPRIDYPSTSARGVHENGRKSKRAAQRRPA